MKPNPASLTAFAQRLFEFFERCATPARSEAEFHQLAQELFALQYALNPVFQMWCRSRGLDSCLPQQLEDLPALPAAAWKELNVTSIPGAERTTEFHSSGTTGQNPSRHIHHAESLSIYRRAATHGFARRFSVVASRPIIWSLTPSPEAAPHSSLAFMLGCFHREFGDTASQFFGRVTSEGWEVDIDALVELIHKCPGSSLPVVMLGTAFNWIHILDHAEFQAGPTPLPPGSLILETGGYKGRSRELPRDELHATLASQFGLPRLAIATEYGMSELSSQAYSEPAEPQGSSFTLRFPPWARALVVSPETGREVADEATGIVRVLDLANVWSALGIQTADLAIRRGSGFELLGRLPAAEARGCSLLSVP